MTAQRRSSLAFGFLLVLLGAWFLAVQYVPGLQNLFQLEMTWPFAVIGVGVLLLVFGIVAGIPAMAIPACIVAGIGGILYWQNATDRWDSWAYAWTLFPGFVGVGMILMGLFGHETRRSIAGGVWLVIISAVLFAIFASFLGGPNILGPYWPVLLIALGVVLLFQTFFRPH